MRLFNNEILTYKCIKYGELKAHQFIIFENKKLFGILFFYFKGGDQDRFHTHAFNAISFKIFGSYIEGILKQDKSIVYEKRTSFIKYFPKDAYHSINKSNGCLTLLFQGPWDKKWKEYKDGHEYELNWHRNDTGIK